MMSLLDRITAAIDRSDALKLAVVLPLAWAIAATVPSWPAFIRGIATAPFERRR